MANSRRKFPALSNVVQFNALEKQTNNDNTLASSGLTCLDSGVSDVSRVYDQEGIISEIIKLSFLSLDDFLYQTAKLITSVKWLNLQSSCAIFLTRHEGKGRVMRMACNYNLEQEVSKKCAHVIFGECLCGKVAVVKKVQYTADINKVDNYYKFTNVYGKNNKKGRCYAHPPLRSCGSL